MTRRTWGCTDRSLAKCCALRVHVTHSYSRVSITWAFSIRTFRLKWSGRPIIQLRAEPFKACLHETGPSFDFDREISALFVDDVAKV